MSRSGQSWEAAADTPVEERWNHNIHRHPLLLDALPDPCGRALDVGCGDGVLTWALADRAAEVVAVDVDAASVERTRALVAGREHVEVLRADVITADLAPASFDAVLAVAVVHHLGLRPGLARLASLVAPGGTLGVVGLARSRSGFDLAHDAVGAVATRVLRRRRGLWEVRAPTADGRDSYTEVLRVATLLLPGVRYRRHALFRYSLVWTRPEDWSPP
ncbi:class I SAM-dependent methyltransferase [Iamia sp. SCSIO 61187]|uniref:class I SAM-dependent methyltransferase n=1 Tax=Iamia sp. SCSIO 61187 TaxID=2722752 RepID=UPI001C63135D|nr:class I SAM-dependent methyltransferase [Iamia sp. SCSIO 61187]QYG94989.1 class I SAM-dependent methyltransferase [Iamia sp. SCSIO 61187]